jgi:hypothetical protein
VVPLYLIINEVTAGNRLDMPAAEDVAPPLPEVAAVISLARECWDQAPARRPTMADVAGRLRGIIGGIKGRRREAQQRAAAARLGSASSGASTAASAATSSGGLGGGDG